MPYDFDKRLLFYKIETTEGTDAAPAAADAILTRSLTPAAYESDTRVRELDGAYYGARPQTKIGLRARATFEVEVAGAGTATGVPAWMKLNRACGMDAGTVGASSVVQKPISTAVPSATLWDYTDTLKQPIVGARGDFRMVFEDDQYPFFAYDFMGYPPTGSLATEATPATPTLTAFQTPVFTSNETSVFLLDGYAAELRRLEIMAGSRLAPRSFVGTVDRVKYRNREWTATAMIRLPAVGSKDYLAHIRNSVQIALSLTQGTVAGNIINVAAARAEVGIITTSEEEGDLMASIPLRLIPTATGNDEITITSS